MKERICNRCGIVKTFDCFWKHYDSVREICIACHSSPKDYSKVFDKKCSKCKEIKICTKFSKDITQKDGYKSSCKYCANIFRLDRKKNMSDGQYSLFRKKANINARNYYATNVEFRVKTLIRTRINFLLRDKKDQRTIKYLGCTTSELMIYLEAQFTEGMTLDLMGQYIHIDHIIPCAYFDLTDPAQQKLCFHYTNLQPMWWYQNLEKNDSLPEGYEVPF